MSELPRAFRARVSYPFSRWSIRDQNNIAKAYEESGLSTLFVTLGEHVPVFPSRSRGLTMEAVQLTPDQAEGFFDNEVVDITLHEEGFPEAPTVETIELVEA